MVQKVGVPSELLICGGVARNVGIVRAIVTHCETQACRRGLSEWCSTMLS
jgi:hypothetical protein